eukprot:SAG11_NODE_3022_length_2757_cov_1.220843_1_plen_65_part_00
MAGIDRIKADLDQKMALLDIDHSENMDKEVLKSAIGTFDLSQYGLDVSEENFDMLFEGAHLRCI